MARGDLTESVWQLLRPLLPKSDGRGRPWRDHRTVLNGVLWIMRTEAVWRDLPARYGSWKTVYARYIRWRKDGTWDVIATALEQHAMAHPSEMPEQQIVDDLIRQVHGAAETVRNS
jgi:transposase